MAEGGRNKRPMFQTWEEKKKKWSCIIDITNQRDDMCLARAIVTGKAKHELKSRDQVWESIKDHHGGHHQSTRATALHMEAKVPFDVCGLDQVKVFQQVVPDYQLCVGPRSNSTRSYTKDPINLKASISCTTTTISISSPPCPLTSTTAIGATNVRRGTTTESITVVRIPARFAMPETARRATRSRRGRIVTTVTGTSNLSNVTRITKRTTQPSKNSAPSATRFINVNYSCQRVINKKYLRKGEEHDCTDLWCRVCRGNFLVGHKCYIKPVKVKENDEEKTKDEKPSCYIFFDVEAQQETGIHKPNLCVAQKVCETCAERPVEDPCDFCGEDKQVIFEGVKCMEEFCLWLLKNERHKRTRCFAHNMKGYDGYFILQYLYDNNIKPKVIMNGAKIMSITLPESRIVFKDTFNFFPMALSKLPKSFGVKELCKGYFPHLKNTKDDENYKGKLPEMECFDPEGMSESAKIEFEKWYVAEKEKVGEEWNLREELLKYCINDIDILRRCMQFRTMFMEVTKTTEEDPGVDPFKKPITIAAACNLVLRRNFLEPEAIAIIPPHGYNPSQNFSRDSIGRLNYKAIEDDTYILHAMNGGEVRLYSRVTADGICLERRRLYSYLGCLFHGCKSCYDEDIISPISGKPMAELYRLTLYRRQQLKTTPTTNWSKCGNMIGKTRGKIYRKM